MKISRQSWLNYIERLSRLNKTASAKMKAYINTHGLDDDNLVEYAYGIATKYGEGSAALAAEMYDLTAQLSGVTLEAAEPAETASLKDVAKAVNGTKKAGNVDQVANSIGRLVKRAGADTTIKNAIRDGAEWAWIPNGDTCAFCLTLASNGWQKASKKVLKGDHASHIHANCDCTFAIRFDKDSSYEGYDPDKYKEVYDNAEGDTSQDKINSLRREKYQQNKDEINAQKRAAYAERIRIRAAQSSGDSVQPNSIKGIFDDFKNLELSQEKKETLTALHNLAQKDDFEHGMAFYKGGKTEIQSQNDHNNVIIGVPIDAEEVELLHCHTDESTLSLEDLSALIRSNVLSTTVITGNGDVWSANMGNGIKPSKKEFAEAAQICYDEAGRIVADNPEFSEWSYEERYYMLIREQMRGLGRYFEWDISGGRL